MFPFTWWARKLNLFLIKSIFRWPATILFKFLIRRDFRSALVIWSTISLSISDFSFKVEEVKETSINICFFISFRKSSMVVPDKIYKALTTFFITITDEVQFAFIQMGFRFDVAMTQKKQCFLVAHFRKFLVDFYCFDVKVVIVRYNAQIYQLLGCLIECF